MGTPTRRMGAILALLLLAATPAWAADKELAHDDGTQADKRSATGTGHAIRYEAPRGDWWIKSVRVHGARYGGGYDPAETMFTVSLCDEALAPILSFEAPYALFASGRFGWVDVPFPRSTLVPRTFQVVVAFDPARTRGVYVGWARTDETHSGYGLPGGSRRPFQADAEWMIRPVLAKKPPRGVAKERVLAVDEGVRTGMKSLGGSGHVVEMKKPSGTWWIRSVLVHGQRYGGGYDPSSTTFSVGIGDTRMKVLHEQRAPYARFSGAFAWAEIRLDEPVKAPSKFRVAVDFDPGRTKGVYVGFTEATKGTSFTGRMGETAAPFREGTWMIRVRLVSEKPEPAPVVERVVADGKVYVKDFEYLARTVRETFDALEKKGVDWKAVCAAWKPRFEACEDDATHVLNARRLLAVLGDMHTGVTKTKVEAHVPSFDGMYGAGLWIATEGEHLVLRALMPGHTLASRLRPGALLLSIDGRPARIVQEEVRQRMRTWHGWSSTHFLDARLSFQFFPFGKKRPLEASFLNPGGEVVDVELPRWGPGGRGLSRAALTMPEGLEAKGAAVSTRLEDDLGYVRILGGMNADTQASFFAALDALKGVKGILLDCRGMGGGGDPAAWAMAGRFFAKRTRLKHDPALQPTGDWQFEGPVVMLQDEREVSSAETFTWAMAETGRAISVGRPTGGATIIPRMFDAPSGLFSFRLGARDRETSVDGVHPEGVGSPPHVFVPYEPALLAGSADPILDVGRAVLRHRVAGVPPDVVVGLYDGVLDPDPDDTSGLEDAVKAWPAGQPPAELRDGLVDRISGLSAGLSSTVNPMPDVRGVERRIRGLGAAAYVLGHEDAVRTAGGHRPDPAEAAAQAAWASLAAQGLPPNPDAVRAYVEEHTGTRFAQAVKAAFD